MWGDDSSPVNHSASAPESLWINLRRAEARESVKCDGAGSWSQIHGNRHERNLGSKARLNCHQANYAQKSGSSGWCRKSDKMDFSDASAVRKLAAAGDQLVRLDFPGGLGPLYCHKFLLSFSSPVLRHVLEDIKQEEGEQCSIPVTGDSDVSIWKLVLSLIYRLETATIALENAGALLLLAHKYDMRSITGRCATPSSAPH
jgi:hypothetical protein